MEPHDHDAAETSMRHSGEALAVRYSPIIY